MPPEGLLPPRHIDPQPLHYIQDTAKYKRGGYYPAYIGDIIASDHLQEFEVLHKLGYGGFSTIWLCRVRGITKLPTYVALKILCADIDETNELRILQHLQKFAGHPNIITLYHSFRISSPNGEHTCLVLPVLGPSLHISKVVKALPGSIRHQVCEQVASAIAFLHDHKLCHGGKTI